MEYYIVWAQSEKSAQGALQVVQVEVREMLQKGFEPIGNVTVAVCGRRLDVFIAAQAMVKYRSSLD